MQSPLLPPGSGAGERLAVRPRVARPTSVRQALPGAAWVHPGEGVGGYLFSCLTVLGIVTIFSTNARSLPANTRAEIDSVETQVVTVQLNGELREVPEGLTLAALLEWLDLPRDRVAVERNLEIVSRSGWDATRIQSGDRLEVVHLVGGGLE